ncbi:hypothetical protein D3OALGA1CA_1456 [Olavius algarvensis associated proteobacterium Delta 3]|nr:hypothetical protein D3OALGA1CA_1456 [Olavius algarvensis associated proteobacterium Delta 3]
MRRQAPHQQLEPRGLEPEQPVRLELVLLALEALEALEPEESVEL